MLLKSNPVLMIYLGFRHVAHCVTNCLALPWVNSSADSFHPKLTFVRWRFALFLHQCQQFRRRVPITDGHILIHGQYDDFG